MLAEGFEPHVFENRDDVPIGFGRRKGLAPDSSSIVSARPTECVRPKGSDTRCRERSTVHAVTRSAPLVAGQRNILVARKNTAMANNSQSDHTRDASRGDGSRHDRSERRKNIRYPPVPPKLPRAQ